jgi:proteasome lid subunit RPN8/RPN11
VLDQLREHARRATPSECCGLLLGTPATVAEAVPTRNLADDPNRFLVDPEAHIAARRDARRRGLEVVGFYHSHPRSSAIPSATDLAEVAYPGHLYAIVSLIEEPAEVCIYRFDGGLFLSVPYVSGP